MTNNKNNNLQRQAKDNSSNNSHQTAFLQAAQQWRIIFDAIPESICLLDSNLTVLRCNSSMAELLKKPFKEIIGKKIDEFETDINLIGIVKKLILQMKGRIERQTEIININNQWYEITIHPVVEQKQKSAKILMILRNITHLREIERGLAETHQKLRKAFHGTVNALATTVEKRDPFTAGHERRVALLGQALAINLGMKSEMVEGILIAGLIHDVGKIVVPAEILSKPGTLNPHEYNIVKSHPVAGYEILKKIEFPWPVADIVLQHHERLNGTGYPNGLTKEKIIFEARVIAVADVVEAMLSKRPYRKAKTVKEAMEELQQLKGSLFDEQVVDACTELFEKRNFNFE